MSGASRLGWLLRMLAEWRRNPEVFMLEHSAAPEIILALKRAGLLPEDDE